MNKVPIYIINLKKHIQNLCQKYDLECNFIDSMHGRNLSDGYISNVYDKEASIHVVQIMQEELDKGAVPDNYKSYLNRLISNELLYIADLFLAQGNKKEALQMLLVHRVKYDKKKKLRLLAILMVPSFAKPLLKKINKYIKEARWPKNHVFL